jgi:Fe-S-cluster containining protein
MSEDNPVFDVLTQSIPIAANAPLGFSCRGCGHLCCVNKTIHVTPPEAARIVWHLVRNPKLQASLNQRNVQWGLLYVSANTGLPGMQLAFIPFNASRPTEGNHCPFFSPVFKQDAPGSAPRWAGLAYCAIHTARPGACRTYPVGMLKNKRTTDLDEVQYIILERCPGFETPGPDDIVAPGYKLPGSGQTVRDYVGAQRNIEQDIERDYYYYDVVPAYLDANRHATTPDAPDGTLTDDEVMEMGKLFYVPPAPPADPADDHTAIMQWLDELKGQASSMQ